MRYVAAWRGRKEGAPIVESYFKSAANLRAWIRQLDDVLVSVGEVDGQWSTHIPAQNGRHIFLADGAREHCVKCDFVPSSFLSPRHWRLLPCPPAKCDSRVDGT
jgi:hypothetical protein